MMNPDPSTAHQTTDAIAALPPTRPGGMTAIAIVTLVFGAIALVAHGIYMLGGGVMSAASDELGAQAVARFGEQGRGAGEMFAAQGNLILVNSLVDAICWLTLMVATIGVMKLAMWGRTGVLIVGGVFIGVDLLTLLTSGVTIGTILGVVYGGVLVGLFLRPDWTAVFEANRPMAIEKPHFVAIDSAGEATADAAEASAPAPAPNHDDKPTGLPGMPPPSAADKDAA